MKSRLSIALSLVLTTCTVGVLDERGDPTPRGDPAAGDAARSGDVAQNGDPSGDAAAPAGDDATPTSFACSELMPNNPAWLLCEDFELGGGVFDDWMAATPFHEFDGEDDRGRLDLVSDTVHSGQHAMHLPASSTSNYQGGSMSWVACDGAYQRGCSLGGYDKLYLRAWVRLATDHEFVHHFLRMGGRYTADSPYDASLAGYWFNGTAGCLPNGETHMDMTVEMERDPGARKRSGYFYSYHSAMEPSPCGGDGNPRFDQICADCNRWDAIKLEPNCSNPDHRCYWGDTYPVADAAFNADPDRYTFPRGEWFCVEAAMTANTPNVSDGKMEYWLNDVAGHSVTDMMWRTVDTVKLNKVSVQHYISGQYWFGTPVQSNKAWLDDIVISTERIGCQ